MTDMRDVVGAQLAALLDEFASDFPSGRDLTEQVIVDDTDTYTHQRYAFYSRQWQEEYERQHRQLFPEQSPFGPKASESYTPIGDDLSQMLAYLDSYIAQFGQYPTGEDDGSSS